MYNYEYTLEIIDTGVETLTKKLNEMGSDGWKAIHCELMQSKEHWVVFFERMTHKSPKAWI